MGKTLITPVLNKHDLRHFIYLPASVHSGDKNWLPPIYMDEWVLFNSKKNKSFAYADTTMLLARKNGKYVGRIMGIISHRYNEYKLEKDARFCFLESVNDAEVVSSLIEAVSRWAKEKGMERLVGPLGFSDKDPQGLKVEGFEHHSLIAMATNSSSLPVLLEKCGFEKKIDLVDFLVDIPAESPPVYAKVLSRISAGARAEVLEFRSTKEMKPYIMEILEVMNQTFTEIYGFIPLTDREKTELAGRYLPILNPEFIKVVAIDGKLIGFAIGMPDISEGLRKSGGRLLPLGIFRILRSAKRTDNLVMLLGGILPEHRGKGYDVMMGASMLNSAIKKGMKTIDSHLVLENNVPMRAEYERLNGKIIRRFRIYQKNL